MITIHMAAATSFTNSRSVTNPIPATTTRTASQASVEFVSCAMADDAKNRFVSQRTEKNMTAHATNTPSTNRLNACESLAKGT